jgi:predicted CXXCH cytochrome family protein
MTEDQVMKTGAWIVALTVLSALVAALCVTVIAQETAGAIPTDSTYAGSKLCGMCHKDEKTAFAETPHAKHVPPADATEPWKHSTGWDRATGQANEPGIQCEACHGRGKTHAGAKTEDKKTVIVNPMNLDSPDKITSVCAQCHAFYTPKDGDAPVAFTPGENLLEKINLLPAEAGKAMQQVNEFVGTVHYTKQHMTCIQCHTSHTEGMIAGNLRKPVPDLCVQCHTDEADIAKHTEGHTTKAKEGDTCATCHMPGGVHTFAKPPK